MVSAERDGQSTGLGMLLDGLGDSLVDRADQAGTLDDTSGRIVVYGEFFELVMTAKDDVPPETFDLVD